MVTFPNCKINLGLHITGKRPDGYHNLESVFVPVHWHDILEIIPSPELKEAEFKSTGIRIYGSKENNLCLRAYKLLQQDFNLPPARFHLHKIIPIGAGLGGGSSDAAFALQMVNKIFTLKLSDEQLEKYAAQLGSDCPFFIKNQPVYATERGDKFTPINLPLKDYYIVLVKPRIHVNTAEAYSWIKPVKRKSELKEFLQLPIDQWKSCVENDFESPVFERYPTIKNIKSRLYKLGAVYASMSGSGSTVYGIFREEKHLNTYFRSSTVWTERLNIEN